MKKIYVIGMAITAAALATAVIGGIIAIAGVITGDAAIFKGGAASMLCAIFELLIASGIALVV